MKNNIEDKEQAQVYGQGIFSGITQKITDYKLLVKMRLTLTVVFSSVMAFLIAADTNVTLLSLIVLSLGGFLVTGAANAFNQVLEKDYDALMHRTADRPLAAGRMKIAEAVFAAGMMSLFGIGLLAMFNPWTAFFGMVALVSYSFLYTPLKRIAPVAVFVGAIPGALPTLIGCTAAEGQLTFLGLTLFAFQFLWQFPHFWSIGWLGFDDYRKAGFEFLPLNEDGKLDRSVGLQSLIYALLLIPIGILPWWIGQTGVVSAILVPLMCVGFAYMAWRFYMIFDRKSARGLMFYSLMLIPLTLIIFALDKV